MCNVIFRVKMDQEFGSPEKIKTCGYFYCTKRQRYAVYAALLLPVVFLVCLIIGLMINAALVEEKFQRITLDPNPSLINANKSVIWQRAERLAEAIKLKTISHNQTLQNKEELEKINEYITITYPNVHNAPFIEKQMINNLSIVFRVNGTHHTTRPYMLCAHLDVVPEGKLDQWDCDPFLGQIVKDQQCNAINNETDDGNSYIFGRGAIDDKHSVFGILEAIEHLVKIGEQPRRTFYIAFGHDEEVSGNAGAGHIREFMEEKLKTNGETLDFILDEGTSVYQDVVPGVDIPIAMISVTEKGIFPCNFDEVLFR